MKRNDSLGDIYGLYREFVKLKKLRRRGWYLRGIKNGETVAEHSFAVSALSLFFSREFPGIDTERVLMMCVLHEFCEIATGDITPADGIPKKEKSALERAAVKKLFQRLGNGRFFLKIWEEFENGETPESRLAKDIDRLEMAFQAIEYKKKHSDFGSEEFLKSALKEIKNPALNAFLKRVIMENGI